MKVYFYYKVNEISALCLVPETERFFYRIAENGLGVTIENLVSPIGLFLILGIQNLLKNTRVAGTKFNDEFH